MPAVPGAEAFGVLDDHTGAVLLEAGDRTAAAHRDVRIPLECALEAVLQIGLVEKVGDRPAQRPFDLVELGQDPSISAYPLHGGIEVHLGVDLVGDACGLEDPQAFVVGVDRAREPVVLRLAFEDQDIDAMATEQIGQRQAGGTEADDHHLVIEFVHLAVLPVSSGTVISGVRRRAAAVRSWASRSSGPAETV